MPRLKLAAAILLGLFVLIQLVPYRVDHPPVTQAMTWDDPAVGALVERACMDCHSNTTKVPWYGYVAPVSWYVNDHVQEAREKLNFSEMDRPSEDAHEAGEVVEEGEMPPAYYIRLHPEADLTDAERRVLSAGLDRNLRPFAREEHDE